MKRLTLLKQLLKPNPAGAYWSWDAFRTCTCREALSAPSPSSDHLPGRLSRREGPTLAGGGGAHPRQRGLTVQKLPAGEHRKHLPIPSPPSPWGRVSARWTPRPQRRIFAPPGAPGQREGEGAAGSARSAQGLHRNSAPPPPRQEPTRCSRPATATPRSRRHLRLPQWPGKVTRAGCGHPATGPHGRAWGRRGLRKRTCSGNVAARLPT